MSRGWRSVPIPDEIYPVCKDYHEENKDELRLREGIGFLTGFINYCFREQLKKIGAIE